jgi:redox-sensitive bicupin YhaK (pirin superfamily)
MIEQIIRPREKDLGDNFMVRRALPYMKRRMVGPFIFWDHMGPVTFAAGKDLAVRAHPHIGLATITFLIEGEIMHRDSLGFEQPIRPGAVNWMTAGKGIVHSERTHSDQSEMSLEGIQVWVALPKDKEDIDPSFVHVEAARVPKIQQGGATLSLIAGEALGRKSPVPIYSELFYLNCVAHAGDRVEVEIAKTHEAAIYVISGQIEVDGQRFERFDLIVLKSGQNVIFKSIGESNTMIFGGFSFPEPRHIWWNLVSTDLEKIEKAKEDWRQQRFPSVIRETEFIPLPEN